MKFKQLTIVVALVSVAVGSTFGYMQLNAQAQQALPNARQFFFVPKLAYTVKFICVNETGESAGGAALLGLEPGLYQTDINIHNPSFQRTIANFTKKFILATPEQSPNGAPPPPPPSIQNISPVPSPYVLLWARLLPDAAVRLDCREIFTLLEPAALQQGLPPGVAKGFVEIISDSPLDVWAEYSTQCFSAAGSQCSGAPAVNVVKIPPQAFTP
jgi:hypothetical protein